MNKSVVILVHLLLGVGTVGAVSAGAPEATRGAASFNQNYTLGLNTLDVTVSFETVQNLSLVNLGLTAFILPDPADPLLLARLPALVTIPAAFPVQVNVSPPSIPLLGLEFTGVASVIVYTIDLQYTPGTRLRLFTAHDGSDFFDITEEVSSGSYRVRGSQGEFSEFLIVSDDRDPAAIVTPPRARLSSLMTTHESAIDTTVFAALSASLTAANSDWLAQDVDGAKADITSFLATAAAATAVEMPDIWRSTEDLVNVAGLLRSAAGTLHFSLEDARDTDADGIYDFSDNCIAVINAGQCDTNGDGHGNHCDADLDNNNIVNSFDLTVMRSNFGASGVNDADLNCNGIVNSFDLSIMRDAFGTTPGPSAPLP